MRSILISVLILVTISTAGCDSLRKAPSEELRQSAQILSDTAGQIYFTGCEPASETAELLKLSSEAAQRYIGLSKKIPTDRFGVLQIARNNAYDPVTIGDITAAADKAIGFAEIAAGLMGSGGIGLGLIKYISMAKKANRTLKELSATKQGIQKFMAQAVPETAAELYKDIETKIAKQNKPAPTSDG